MNSLRTKLVVSVGLLLFVVLGISSFVHIQDLKGDYLEALELRSEALVQGIRDSILNLYKYNNKNYDLVLGGLMGASFQCMQIYERNKETNISHVAVIDAFGTIVAHSDEQFLDASYDDPVLLPVLQAKRRQTVMSGGVYHILMPLIGGDEVYLGTLEVGVFKSAVDEKVRECLVHTVMLFVFFLVMTLCMVLLMTHVLLTKPVQQLVVFGQEFARGNLSQQGEYRRRNDEIGVLTDVFERMSGYLRTMAGTASQIATGSLVDTVEIRSPHDILGRAFQSMIGYLHEVAEMMQKVAEGDLRSRIRIRSEHDAFGQAIHAMTTGLQALIAQIRSNVQQTVETSQHIAALALEDFEIVQEETIIVEDMVSTMAEMGTSVGEVTHNMEELSVSMEQTSASVSQMAASIRHIASSTTELSQQTNQTIRSLRNANKALEKIVENIDMSQRLSHETNQDALEGQQAVELVIGSMDTIHHTITAAVEAINRFSQRSQDIDSILEVIRNITDQTSLLALNASIIAAQAGSHGRGFAVVAEEIRSLADGVGSSTKDIAAIVHALKKDANEVTQAIYEGSAHVEQGMQHTQQAREMLEKILASAQRSSSVVTEIAETLYNLMETSHSVSSSMETVEMMTQDITRATNEQKITTEQIDQVIVYINDMAVQNHRAATEQLHGAQQVVQVMEDVMKIIMKNQESSHQITQTSEELSIQAKALLQAVERFKLAE